MYGVTASVFGAAASLYGAEGSVMRAPGVALAAAPSWIRVTPLLRGRSETRYVATHLLCSATPLMFGGTLFRCNATVLLSVDPV